MDPVARGRECGRWGLRLKGVHLLHDLLEVEVTRSSKRASLDGREGRAR